MRPATAITRSASTDRRPSRLRTEDLTPVALAAMFAVLGWHTAWNLGGPAGAVGSVAAVALAVLFLRPWAVAVLRAAPSWVLPALVTGVLLALSVAFAVGVPPAYRDALGVGSDRANALDVALGTLAAGHYPYAATTYLGNPITPLPGALVLAAPFWWLTGSAATQNVAWTAVLLVVLGRGPRPRPGAVVLWLLAVVAGLEVVREFLVGDDLVTGAVPALAASAVTLTAARRSPAVLVAAAVALGVATCTRPHMALVVLIVAVAVGLAAGVRRGLLVGGVAAMAWAALIAPFLLGGLARFSPLHVAAKVTGERGLSVGIAAVALLALALLVAALLVLRPAAPASVGRLAAAVLFAPTLLSLARGLTVGPLADVDLTLGAAAVPFALWAMARPVASPP